MSHDESSIENQEEDDEDDNDINGNDISPNRIFTFFIYLFTTGPCSELE